MEVYSKHEMHGPLLVIEAEAIYAYDDFDYDLVIRLLARHFLFQRTWLVTSHCWKLNHEPLQNRL